MTAGIETLKRLNKPGVYEQLEDKTRKLAESLSRAADNAGLPNSSSRAGAMLSLFFTAEEVKNRETVETYDEQLFEDYFCGMLEEGIYLAPSQFEAGFVSLAHTEEDITRTARAAERVFDRIG